MTRGRPPGLPKTGGRKKGSVNKKTALARETAQKFLDAVPQSELRALWNAARKDDPVGALRIYYTALEFVAPKLQRVEQTGPGGKPQAIEIRHVQLTFDGGKVAPPLSAAPVPVLLPPPDE